MEMQDAHYIIHVILHDGMMLGSIIPLNVCQIYKSQGCQKKMSKHDGEAGVF